MRHRHLNHQRFTLAAIDDVISRGRWGEWAELRREVLSDRALLDKVERVCRPYASDPYAQRHQFWMHYVKEHRSAPDLELGLSSAPRLQRIPPNAAPGGGATSAPHAEYRLNEVLAEIESAAGWGTALLQDSLQALVSLDGIETGIRQFIRDEPLETTVVDYHGSRIAVPTEGEILRIKGVLILKRNATRDYLDFVSLADHMGDEIVANVLQSFDRIYRQDNGESPLQQLQVQLANALPYDLGETELSEYKNLNPRWHDWPAVKAACSHLSTVIFDQVCDMDADHSDGHEMEP